MRTVLLLTMCAGLLGCQAYVEGIQDEYSGLFKTRAEREADDMTYCQRLGAQPGTDIFIQCMLGRAQIRATNQAAAATSAAANRASFDAQVRANQASGLAPLPAFQPGPATCAQAYGQPFHPCP